MTDSNYQHLVVLADRSGSMINVAKETSQGIANYIAAVAEATEPPARATVSLFEFDNTHSTVFEFQAIRAAPEYTLVPRGATALLDAAGFVIARTGEQLAAMPESQRPGTVVMLIATDGEENASREYTLEQIKTMITRQQDTYGWVFVYIGANHDSFSAASAMGVPVTTTLNYNTNCTSGTYASVASMVTRGTASGLYSFDLNERNAASGLQDTTESG